MPNEKPEDYLGKTVRFDNPNGHYSIIGKVLSYADKSTYQLELPNGGRDSVLASFNKTILHPDIERLNGTSPWYCNLCGVEVRTPQLHQSWHNAHG